MELHEPDVYALLSNIRRGLDQDGYDLEIVSVGDGVELDITAREDACEDCLVGKQVMREMIADSIADMYEEMTAESVTVRYPADGAGSPVSPSSSRG